MDRIKPELVCPADGGVSAVIRAGANAVYYSVAPLHLQRQMKMDKLAEEIRACRLRGVKIRIIMDDPLNDEQIIEARDFVDQISQLGVDALTVGDLGLMRMARAVAPQLPMYGSVKLAVHHLSGVLAARELGFSRVMLARELSLCDISFIIKNAPIETEILVCGLLCPASCARCAFPMMIRRREGEPCSRLCSQPMAFFSEAPERHLSMKALNLASHLGELQKAGVRGIVVGDMGDPMAGALATKLMRGCLDTGEAPDGKILDQLRLFFPQGLTDGYLTGEKGELMRAQEADVPKGQLRALKKLLKREQHEPEAPSVAVDMSLSVSKDGEAVLYCRTDDQSEYTVRGTSGSRGRMEADEKQIEDALRDTEGTVFFVRQVHLQLDGQVPMPVVNLLRRQCTDGLSAVRRQIPRRDTGAWQPGLRRLSFNGTPELIFSFLHMRQISPVLLEMVPAYLYLPLWEASEHLDQIEQLTEEGHSLAAVMDPVVFDSQWPETVEALRRVYQAGVKHVLCSNIGQAHLLKQLGFSLRGDWSLNANNSQTLKELRSLGFDAVTLSPVLSFSQIKELSLGIDGELIAYGRMQLLTTENCLIKRRSGSCSCDISSALTDRSGRSFPLLPEHFCRDSLYYSDKLWLAGQRSELMRLGVRYLRLAFTTENVRECQAVAMAYRTGAGNLSGRTTTGNY